MPAQLLLPKLDEPATEVTVERYFQPIGAVVEPGQPVALVASAQYEWEIPATSGGTIEEIVAAPGSRVAVGAALLALRPQDAASASTTELRAPRATPVALRIATFHGVDVSTVTGTGWAGRVTRSDVLALVKPAEAAGIEAENNKQPLEPSSAALQQPDCNPQTAFPPRRQIPPRPRQHALLQPARDVDDGAPVAASVVEVDLAAVHAYIERFAGRFTKRGLRLGVLECIAYACVAMLPDYRMLNSAWSEEGIVIWGRINLDVAGAQDDHGRSVVQDAAALSLQGLIGALAAGPQRSPTQPTFTIRGRGEGWWSAPDRLPHQCPLLNVGSVAQRAHVVAENQTDVIKIRPLTILTLAYDARMIDPLYADAFLVALKDRLEHFSAL